eukprot:TRINITY_DN1338_c0_g1_i4.p2 TRINITY_DN1338_c0_g1~~TRINITY_DN1338_c0_g1_i4.p2  ORF type:complete len:197 (-),score=82.46 TRINITY_DN1338_c0_g1_i4:167-757(-)
MCVDSPDCSWQPSSMPQVQAAPPAAAPTNPAAAIPSNPAAAGGGQPAGGMPAGMQVTPEMLQLMQDPQMQQMLAMVQQNPQVLEPMLQQIQQSSPELMQTIAQNQEAFMAMLSGGLGGMGGEAGEGMEGQQQAPPGTIMVTAEEKAALEQLEVLFPNIDRAVIFQTYKACDGDQQMTTNLLMDNAQDFMMDDSPGN